MEKKYNIDEHLKRTLEQFEAQPDIRSFHEIMRKMNEKKKRRRFIIFFWFGLLLFGASTFTFFNSFFNKSTPVKIISKTEIPTIKTNKVDKKSTYINSSKKQVTSNTNSTHQKTDTAVINTLGEKTGKTKTGVIKDPASKINISANNSITSYINNTATTTKNTFSNLKGEKEIKIESSVPGNEGVSFLPIKIHYLQIDTTQKELLKILPDTLALSSFSLLDSLKEEKKKIRFYIGINLEPKLSSYMYSKNSNRNALYNDGSDFADQYLKGKKAQSAFRFNYAFGIKAGLNVREKYEVFIGFGFQNFKETEELYDYSTPAPSPKPPAGQYAFAFGDMKAASKVRSNFNYYYYSVDASRIYKLSSKIHYKAGLGFQANQLRGASFTFVTSPNTYNYSNNQYHPISKWTYTTVFKSGIMFDAGKRWQFQLCPTAFYSPTSIFKKDYVIKERPYGFSLECLVLFRLF